MEALHAPWRMAYLRAPKPEHSTPLFTRLARSTDDVANYVIARDKTCYAVLNGYPYAAGHLLIVPYKQTPDFNGLNDEEMCGLLRLTRRCQNALTRALRPDGFNVGVNIGSAAGAGVAEHVHIHVVPRWKNDVNFMPVLGETTIISEALAEVATKLRAELAADVNG